MQPKQHATIPPTPWWLSPKPTLQQHFSLYTSAVQILNRASIRQQTQQCKQPPNHQGYASSRLCTTQPLHSAQNLELQTSRTQSAMAFVKSQSLQQIGVTSMHLHLTSSQQSMPTEYSLFFAGRQQTTNNATLHSAVHNAVYTSAVQPTISTRSESSPLPKKDS